MHVIITMILAIMLSFFGGIQAGILVILLSIGIKAILCGLERSKHE